MAKTPWISRTVDYPQHKKQQAHQHGSTRYSAPRFHGAICWTQMGTVGYSALEKLRAEDLAPFVASGNQVGSPSLGSEQVYGIVLCCHD